MSSDYNVVLQPDGTYRYLKNCQLVSQDGNNFVIKDCLGNVLTFTVNAPYDAVYTSVGASPMIIGMISFPDKLITITDVGEIGIIKYIPYGEGVQPLSVTGEYNAGYVPLYHSTELNLSKLHRINGFSYIENELIERIYWTDNFNEPRVFNVSDPIFTNYFSSGSLVTGEQYMVLEGAIQHPIGGANPIYGPGLTAGNTFTASSATYTNLTAAAPTPKIIAYYPPSLLDFTPSRSLGNIIFKEYGSGSLYCGSKTYFYRLGTNDGVVTTWSYGSSPIPVGTLNDSFALTSPNVPYHDFVGGGTTTALLNSGLSVLINIENVDEDFDYIEVACAEFDQLATAPRQISIIAKDVITSPTMVITHDGTINLGILTIGDITLFPASILKCKTLATNKNFILTGNITERIEFDWDANDYPAFTAAWFQYPMNSHYDATSCSLSGMVPSGISPPSGGYMAAGPTAAGSITPFSKWLVTSGTVTYNGTNYTTGQVFEGVPAVLNSDIATLAAASSFVPCVNKNRYTTFAGDPVPNAIEIKRTTDTINDCFWDYKSAAAHHHLAGYWSGETYRFGMLFYDKKGNPFYVKWLLDYQMPSVYLKTGYNLRRDQIGTTGNYVYSLNPSGMRFQGITLPQEVVDQISGFSIVRAERDARIVTQGLVTQNVDTGASPKVYRPAAWNPISADTHNVASKIYTYMCPDILVDAPLKKAVGVIGDTMEEAVWLDPYDYGGGSVVRGQGVAGSEQVYTKYLSCLNDNSLRTGTITYFDSVDESQTLSNLGNGDTYENGTMQVAVAAGTVVKGTCVTGGLDYNLDGYNATGCKKTVFILETDFKHYGPSANDYTSVAAMGQMEKIVMNYVKTGFANPYGGTGDSSKANTLYISTGHFQPINASVLADVFDGTNYVFNDVEVFGGDCYTCMIDQGYALWDAGFVASRYSYAWTFPCECNSNYNLRRGRKTSNVEMYYTGTALTESITVLGPAGEINLEDYSYNQGYSTEGQQVVYPALPIDFINSSSFQARIRYAGEKFIGESIDSFRTFAINDYKDLSANYGRINSINVKEDKVVVFQDNAINTVPILERQVVSGVSGDATTIGTGGVVDRFDVISSYFGTQHQWSITETEYGFAFFDMRRKAFVILDFGGGLLEISQVFGLKAFFDEVFMEIEGTGSSDTTILLNSPTFEETADRPLVGVGITSVYDPKFKMTYMTFKFYGQNADGTKSKDFTIGYLHTNTKKCFVGFYDWFPCIAHNHNQIVLSVNNPKNTTQYLPTVPTNESFVVGETLWGDSGMTDEYICIADVTLDNAAKFPKGASGATYWFRINKINQLWVNNQPAALTDVTAGGYQYNMFFGRVVDNELHIVINPKQQGDEAFYVQNISQNGPYNINYTSIYADADSQAGADLNITGTNRNYRFIFDKITSTVMRDATTGARIINKYLRMRFVKRNWTTVPISLETSVKILRSITSYFNTKR